MSQFKNKKFLHVIIRDHDITEMFLYKNKVEMNEHREILREIAKEYEAELREHLNQVSEEKGAGESHDDHLSLKIDITKNNIYEIARGEFDRRGNLKILCDNTTSNPHACRFGCEINCPNDVPVHIIKKR